MYDLTKEQAKSLTEMLLNASVKVMDAPKALELLKALENPIPDPKK